MLYLLTLLCACAAPPVPVGDHVPPDGVEPAPLFGVDLDKLGAVPEGRVRYTLNGRPVGPRTAYESLPPAPVDPEPIEAPELPDPAGKIHVTVIGSDADRAAVMRDLATSPALASRRPRLVVREYRPDHWHVADVGFKVDGKPTIYVQTEDGIVRHRQDVYQGPAPLATALRKADPQYDPKLDPDASVSPALHLKAWELASKIPPTVWVLGAAGVLLILTRKDK